MQWPATALQKYVLSLQPPHEICHYSGPACGLQATLGQLGLRRGVVACMSR